MIRSMRLMSVAVILAVVAFALVGQTPASAQTFKVHCGIGMARGPDVVNGTQTIQTCVPVANNVPARPIVIQSGGFALSDEPVYQQKGQVPRWGANPLNPWQAESIGSFSQGDPVYCLDRDRRSWAADQCLVTGQQRPLTGWSWCNGYSCQKETTEIEDTQGGYWNLNPLNTQSLAAPVVPQALPATGGNGLPPGGCPPGTTYSPGRGCF